jgi:Peptidase MA superfamily
MYRRIYFYFVLLALQIAALSIPQSASSREIVNSQVSYTFAGQVVFRANIESESPIEEVLVFMRNVGETNTIVGGATIENGEATYTHDLTKQPLRAFSEVEYWYAVKTQDNEIQNSETFTFFYEDNRFNWQVLEDPPFRVHWYEGDIDFAQTVLDAAQAGLKKSMTLLNLKTPEQVDIYVYASGLEMQSTLRLAGLDWVAGHADPDLNVMVVSLPPGPDQRLETERQIPHELAHILMYQTIPEGYVHLPSWFKEGLASINELRPNPDYYIILNNAVEKNSLIPMKELCENFPTDASGIYLAYAQADSFTRYLNHQFGLPGIQGLLNNYSTGLDCERGTELGLGSSLKQLELHWIADISGRTTTAGAVDNLLPWAFILMVVLGAPALLSIGYISKRKKPTTA